MSYAEKELFGNMIPSIKEMLDDPSIQEFHPTLEKILAGCEDPSLNNVDDVIKTFDQNDAAYHIRQISDVLCKK